jgi:Cell division protein
MLENIANNLNKALLFSAVVGVLFFSLALYLLYSTMKLWLFIKRFSVRIMQLVGATPQFICRPFIKQSITVGALGATLAVLILLIFYFILLNFVPDLKRQDFVLSFVGILALLYLLGVLITGVSASLIINRYLRSKTEELY